MIRVLEGWCLQRRVKRLMLEVVLVGGFRRVGVDSIVRTFDGFN